MRFRSRQAAALVGAVLFPVVGLSVVSTNQYILVPEAVAAEDVYVAADRAVVQGRIAGDLTIAAGEILIPGTVEGDVLVASSDRVVITGMIGGSLRGVAPEVVVDGTVTDDVAVASLQTTIRGTVGRDLLVFTARLRHEGTVGRDVRGQLLEAVFAGRVGHDVDVSSEIVRVESAAVVDGDFVYRSGRAAAVSGGAVVSGSFDRLPGERSFRVRVIIRLITVLGFLSFLVSGVLIFWLLRRTGPRAASEIETRPARAVAIGLGVLLVAPLFIAGFGVSLLGIPIAVLLLVGYLLLLMLGPVPALAVAGNRALRGRPGLIGGFLLAAIVLRLAGLLPGVGVALLIVGYLAALVVGTGGWVGAAWAIRKEGLAEADPITPAFVGAVRPEAGEPPDDWEPPLPPAPPGS